MIDTSTDTVKSMMDVVTPGKAVQFHPSYCEEAKGAAFSDLDTSHHVSVIRSDDGSRYRIAEFRHASEAAFHQSARDLVPALLAERDALAQGRDRLQSELWALQEAHIALEGERNKLRAENERLRVALSDFAKMKGGNK